MHIEIETKLKVESHDAVREALRAAGAERCGAWLETNHILDAADGRLRSGGGALRVREERDRDNDASRCTMTYKGPVEAGRLKRRTEIEMQVDDAERCLAVMEHLGYEPRIQFEKRREQFRLAPCTVELDELPHLGCYVEIEGPDEAAIEAVQRQLGLEQLQHVRQSYVEMLAGHSVAGADPLCITFDQ